MKRSSLLMLPVLFGLACGEGGTEPLPAEDLQASSAALSAVFSGTVVDANNRPIANARVTVNGITRITSSTGAYSLSVTEAQTGYVLDVRKDGYGPVNKLQMSGQLSQVHVLRKAYTVQISPTVNTVVQDQASGIRVDVLANTLRTATGALPSGSVSFSIVPHGPDTMPGDFTARNAAGQTVALETVGAVTLSAVDGLGNTLALASGASMNVRLPVPAALGGTMPACVLNGSCRTVMWRFNPSTGLWIEQSTSRQFSTTATTFQLTGVRQGGTIDPADGLGTWNTDIEKVTPSCSIIEFVSIPLPCYNPLSTSPEPGLTLSLSQTSSGGALWTSNGTVRSSATFIAQYNLPFNAPLQLAVAFPTGAPAYCAANLSLSATPGPFTVTGNAIQYNSGAPASAPGYPKDSAGNPIDFSDVVLGDHTCSSHIYISTHP
ncbi:carboxypeptidase regulatory-like domain-containing protein [Archangium violaceum]|uniref:carboxypeptidase regulatory-like domain-containing protein n=1 Tax=Archangium violaceum TaxID=83451 RepID=UPI0036D997B5